MLSCKTSRLRHTYQFNWKQKFDNIRRSNFLERKENGNYNNNNNNILLKIRKITNYITFPPQIAYELIEAGRSEDILQVQSLSIYRWTK